MFPLITSKANIAQQKINPTKNIRKAGKVFSKPRVLPLPSSHFWSESNEIRNRIPNPNNLIPFVAHFALILSNPPDSIILLMAKLKMSRNGPFLGRGKANLEELITRTKVKLDVDSFLPILSYFLSDIFNLTPHELREGLDGKIVVKQNITGVFQD